jgi:hypothetical protein
MASTSITLHSRRRLSLLITSEMVLPLQGDNVSGLFSDSDRRLLTSACHRTSEWYGGERQGVEGNGRESDTPYYAGAYLCWGVFMLGRIFMRGRSSTG